jgi:hypothetical protein
VQTRLKLKAPASPPRGPSHADQAFNSEQHSKPNGCVETLEALAKSLREQLQTLDLLIESERNAGISA